MNPPTTGHPARSRPKIISRASNKTTVGLSPYPQVHRLACGRPNTRFPLLSGKRGMLFYNRFRGQKRQKRAAGLGGRGGGEGAGALGCGRGAGRREEHSSRSDEYVRDCYNCDEYANARTSRYKHRARDSQVGYARKIRGDTIAPDGDCGAARAPCRSPEILEPCAGYSFVVLLILHQLTVLSIQKLVRRIR